MTPPAGVPRRPLPARPPRQAGALPPPGFDLGPERPAVSRLLDRLRLAGVMTLVGTVTLAGIPLQWMSLKLGLDVRRHIRGSITASCCASSVYGSGCAGPRPPIVPC